MIIQLYMFKLIISYHILNYHSIDQNECLIVNIQGVQNEKCICYEEITNFGSKQNCNVNSSQSIRNTQIIEISHIESQARIIVSSTANQELSDESYLFRNVQLFLYRCHKTCSGERKDQCKTCYTQFITSTNQCEPCKNGGNEDFLDIQAAKCVQQ
ncbi:unnamed protein product [Paramecium sonneborni]|uniref:Uncharacterized protein n=1 Tax=Paramecium sonneborni TaxID=65129 RepID=A0A8S1RPL9_9CILI|nr:unnamed protein product [Paramecium sonneborni]